MIDRPQDRFWVTPEQKLMLTAALCDGDTALAAWHAWRRAVDGRALDAASLRLAGLLRENMLRLGVEDPILSGMKDDFRLSWYHNQQLLHRLRAVLTKLHAAGIAVILLKGCHLAVSYYDNIALRPMADLDILVRYRDWPQVMAVLTGDGWEPVMPIQGPPLRDPLASGCNAVALSKDGVELDVHGSPFHECLDPEPLEPLWAAAVPVDLGGVTALGLGAADLMVHGFAHGVRMNVVGPIRCVADAVMILRREPEFDWDRLALTTLRLGLRAPVLAGLAVLAELMPDRVPPQIQARLCATPPSLVERIEWYARSRDGLQGPGVRFGIVARLTSGLPLHRRLPASLTLLRSIFGARNLADTAWIGLRKTLKMLRHLV